MLAETSPKDNVPLSSSASVKPTMTAPGAILVCLNEILLDLVLSSLDSASLMNCLLVCRRLHTAVQKDDLWRAKCLEDWGESRSVLPEKRSEPVPTYLEAWRGWRKSFGKYNAEDVKRVAVWWAGIEEWMKVNLHEVLDSLNEGVSEADLDKAEEQLGWPLPTHLRLLYRFHNGQWLPWGEKLDASFGVNERRPSARPKIEGSGVSLGLLGGYCFYNRMTSSKLFSLQRGVQAGLATAAFINNQNEHFLEGHVRCWGIDLRTIRNRGGFLLAASHLSKRAWVGKDGNVRFDGNFPIRGAFDAAPVVSSGDDSAAAGGSSGGGGRGRPDGNLMPWLEEYLRRLQRGHYGVRSRWREPYVNYYGMRHERRLRGVWLFPEEGGQYCVTEVTKGVQVQVAPVFVPEECENREIMLWAYSVRMKLLRGHPTRPQLMSSCQLSTRHLEIDGLRGFHREISGEGVIGEYPLLKCPPVSSGGVDSHDDGSSPYEYESSTTLENPPGTMGGHLTFMPGDLSAPTGPAFNVRVPKFELVQPDFIF